MNKEIVLLELGEAAAHLKDLIQKIKEEDGLRNPYDLEVGLRHVIAHISRGYNYRNIHSKDYLQDEEKDYRKSCQPPSELLPFPPP